VVSVTINDLFVSSLPRVTVKNQFPFNSIFLVGRTLVLPIFLSKKCSWEGDRLIWEGSPVFV
ncbi:hypothetical protein RLB89_11565, partial [Streptococcus pneumoniae]|nr:hypothetical protein [Streptococcus pneumoniae]